MKVQILMPMYKIMDAPAIVSLVAFILDAANQNVSVAFTTTNVADIAKARNGLVKALADNVDYLLFIDSDMTYKYSQFLSLIKIMQMQSLDLLSAKYYTRNNLTKDRKLAMLRDNGEGKKEKIAEDGARGIQKCDVIGLGFCVIRPQLIRDLLKTNKKLFRWEENGDGEDAYFCSLVKKHGHEIYYDADTTVGHISTVINK